MIRLSLTSLLTSISLVSTTIAAIPNAPRYMSEEDMIASHNAIVEWLTGIEKQERQFGALAGAMRQFMGQPEAEFYGVPHLASAITQGEVRIASLEEQANNIVESIRGEFEVAYRAYGERSENALPLYIQALKTLNGPKSQELVSIGNELEKIRIYDDLEKGYRYQDVKSSIELMVAAINAADRFARYFVWIEELKKANGQPHGSNFLEFAEKLRKKSEKTLDMKSRILDLNSRFSSFESRMQKLKMLVGDGMKELYALPIHYEQQMRKSTSGPISAYVEARVGHSKLTDLSKNSPTQLVVENPSGGYIIQTPSGIRHVEAESYYLVFGFIVFKREKDFLIFHQNPWQAIEVPISAPADLLAKVGKEAYIKIQAQYSGILPSLWSLRRNDALRLVKSTADTTYSIVRSIVEITSEAVNRLVFCNPNNSPSEAESEQNTAKPQ